MIGPLLSLSTIGALMLAAISAVGRKKIYQSLPLLGLFLFVYFLDNLIHLYVNSYPALQIIPNGSYQNSIALLWSAKLYSILACLLIVFVFRSELSPGLVGLAVRQNPGSLFPCILAVVAAGGIAALLGLGFDKGLFDPVVLVYMSVMPGLNEELVYRGLLLGLLDQILPQKRSMLGAQIGWGVLISALLFGLLHGFWIEADWTVHINAYPVLFNCLTGALFAWQKERMGSLAFPIFTHGVIDFLIVAVRMV